MRGRATTAIFVAASACTAAPSDPTSPPDSAAAHWYYARDELPCGRSLLSLAEHEDGPRFLAQPRGPRVPSERLRRHAAVWNDYRVRGVLTGHIVDDGHCGAYPELEVIEFEACGEVVRRIDTFTVDPSDQFYTEPLSSHGFVPQDYVDGPRPPRLAIDTCQDSGVCTADEVSQQNADGRDVCCRLALESAR